MINSSNNPSIQAWHQVARASDVSNVPRLETSPRYYRWLRRLLVTQQDKKAVGSCNKADVNHSFHEQASQRFENDNELLEEPSQKYTRVSRDKRELAEA